ncbi:threonine/serine ThrE exporter family protein [Breznakiella homolactica]|uniref:Threonine/serine exporter family protein n=1 Tax=Breznakiella homolactica TaxID=2798577 RepID=A0A7T7XMD4_9SPIR|nr:threonine/serine exporter family protein [Breznakiella homolactica]QQO08908.1 threonine/serine exporter family protein [Breznakiella homolactica]
MMKNEQAILRFAVSAGEVLLKNGGEIFRVQETISRILEAFGLRNHSLYILSNGIFVTLNEGDENNCFALRFVPSAKTHLGRIAAVNELSRKIGREGGDPVKLTEYEAELAACESLPFAPLWIQVLACAAGSGSFCFLFGGKAFDCLAAFVCGIVLQLFLSFYGKRQVSRYIPTILGSAVVSLMAAGMVSFFSGLSLGHIIVGSVIALVPGVAFTTSIREFFNGDYLSGSIHLIDALLTGICIAAGVATSLWVWQLISGRGLFL